MCWTLKDRCKHSPAGWAPPSIGNLAATESASDNAANPSDPPGSGSEDQQHATTPEDPAGSAEEDATKADRAAGMMAGLVAYGSDSEDGSEDSISDDVSDDSSDDDS